MGTTITTEVITISSNWTSDERLQIAQVLLRRLNADLPNIKFRRKEDQERANILALMVTETPKKKLEMHRDHIIRVYCEALKPRTRDPHRKDFEPEPYQSHLVTS
jgi:hypothetical protein